MTDAIADRAIRQAPAPTGPETTSLQETRPSPDLKGWTQMPNVLMNRLSPRGYKFYGALKHWLWLHRKRKHPNPSLPELAAWCRCSIKMALRYRHEVIEAKLLAVTPGGGRGNRSQYWLLDAPVTRESEAAGKRTLQGTVNPPVSVDSRALKAARKRTLQGTVSGNIPQGTQEVPTRPRRRRRREDEKKEKTGPATPDSQSRAQSARPPSASLRGSFQELEPKTLNRIPPRDHAGASVKEATSFADRIGRILR